MGHDIDRLRQEIEAAERERGRWARELHDETLQGLGALRVLLASALLRGSQEALAAATREALAQLEIEIQNLRGMITELRPAALDEIGLEAAIQGLVERIESTEGVAVRAELLLGHAGEDGGLSPEIENTLYRLVQEALNNIVKHARAEYVRLRMAKSGKTIEVVVADDGVGFDPERDRGGFGLLGMRERVEMAGGSLEVDSSPGKGARLRALIPAP
jgi:signal transduction histidine kinase